MNLNLQIDPMIETQSSLEMSESTLRFGGMTLSEHSLRINGRSLTMEVRQGDLVMGKRIGAGACSSVHVAQHKESGEMFAVKMFNVYDSDRKKQLQKELSVLLEFNCDCLVSFFGVSYNEGTVGLILEFMDCGSLDCLMNPKVEVPERVMAAITYQIIWGLCYLHHDHNIHRDLKPGNVVMNSRGEVKLSDFGIFRSLETTVATSETFTGTYKFMSPERLEGKSYNEAADIWSLGVMVLQLWTKKYPFKGGEYSPLELIDVLENTDVRAFAPADVVPPAMAKCVISMLAFEPERRSTAVELMKCEWMERNEIFGLDEAQAMVADWVALAFPDIKLESIMSPTGTSSSSESKRTFDDDDDTEDAKGHGGVDDDRKNDRDVKRRGSGSGAQRKNYEAKFSDGEEDERDNTHGRK